MRGGAASSKKGTRRERQLVNTLDACGFAAMRCPDSGSATKRDLPDVIAARPAPRRTGPDAGSQVWALEVKATGQTTAYADGAEIDALRAFADAAGGEAYLTARFDQDTTFYLVEPEFCRKTDGGNYGVPKASAADRAAWCVDAGVGRVLDADGRVVVEVARAE